MTVYFLDAYVADSDTITTELAKGNLSVLTGEGYLDRKTGVNSGLITGWTMPSGGTEITVASGECSLRVAMRISSF